MLFKHFGVLFKSWCSDLRVCDWFEKNTFKSQSYSDVKRLIKLKRKGKHSISLCIPTLNEEKSVGKVISVLKSALMDHRKLIDEIIVIDSGSTDGTKEIVEGLGIPFYKAKKILKRRGKARGKGENLWKSLYLAKGDIIIWIDADIENIHPRYVYGLVGPLLTNNKIKFTKAFFQRPAKARRYKEPLGGGRVTELLVRPLFNMYFPSLSGFIQPLSGQCAGYRGVFERIPFFTGYGVETGMLIDVDKKFGLKSMGQVDLVSLKHKPSDLSQLSEMSFGILQVFSKRANTLGKLILVKKIKKTYTLVQSEKEKRKVNYHLRKKEIVETQRPPIITLNEYRRKFKKEIEEF